MMYQIPCKRTQNYQTNQANSSWKEQKLYDIGECIYQLTQHPSHNTIELLKESTVDIRDILYGILTALSQIRGSQSYLLPALLQQSQALLGFEDVPYPLSEVCDSSETNDEEPI